MKIILITNIPTPYRLPLWDELKNKSNLEVICISTKEKNRQWNIENRSYIQFLKSFHFYFQRRDLAIHVSIPLNLFFKLFKKNPDAIIVTGYDSIQYWEALLYATIFSKKKIMWNGSTCLSSRSNNKFIRFIKSFFINSFNSYYTYGTKATQYLESFGVNTNKIVTGINTVDTEFYKNNTSNKSLNNNFLSFLYVGQLIERKGLEVTIEAFSKVNKNNWLLTIVGTGSDELKLKKLVDKYGLSNKIIFVGYKQKEEILHYYSQADIFLMPSYLEVWGLVLNEALSSGLFCLASKYAGSTFDLIKNGENGYIIDPKDINNYKHYIEKTFNLTLDKEKIKNSFIISYESEANKIIQAVKKAEKNENYN